MIKIISRILSFLTIIIIIIISYLSLFGIKTNKFNEVIKSQIINKDKRLNIDLEDVFIKLNIKEMSLSLNSQNVTFFIFEEKQKFANLNLYVSIDSIIKQDNKIKKIVINSKENKINNLLKFIKAYKINVPALYLENSISKGDIIYNIDVNLNNDKIYDIKISGKIIDTDLSILGRESFKNIDFDFNYRNKKLEILNLECNYKDLTFTSKNISAYTNNNIINIDGDFKNKIDLNLLSSFFKYDFKEHLSEKISLNANSNFQLELSNKFKIKKYQFKSNVDFKNLDIKLTNLNLNNYISPYENKITLKNGKINFSIDNQKKNELKINSKFILSNKNIPKDISLRYSKLKSIEKFDFKIDLTNYELNLADINFKKSVDEEMFFNIITTKSNKNFEIKNLKLFNDRNTFYIENVELNENFKIKNFKSLEAEFYNTKKYKNDISITNKNNLITVSSDNLDISLNIENVLKKSEKISVIDAFEKLNSKVKINIKSAKIDNDYSFNNLFGDAIIKNNKLNKANISAKFDSKNKFLYTKDKIEGNKVTTIFSDVAKPFVKKFNFINGFEDGKLDYTSTEISNNLSQSELRIYDFKLQDMPALTKLLSLASLQGIADLATGEGIRFNEFDMFFDNSKNLITIKEIYALGPAISILMEGYVEKNKLVSLRGTLVPATTINKTISKIPLLGSILVGDKVGEGVFGVSFKIKGPPDKLDTRVNPIKTLTPRFITRTLEKIKKSN